MDKHPQRRPGIERRAACRRRRREFTVETGQIAPDHTDQVPPEVELTPPPPPDDTPPDGAWNPLFDELLLDPFDELPDDPVDPLELVPELDVEPVDELELEEDLLPVLVAAWLVPGSINATTPATATLARDTVVVVAFSRRRPCSRSATARATCRAASR